MTNNGKDEICCDDNCCDDAEKRKDCCEPGCCESEPVKDSGSCC